MTQRLFLGVLILAAASGCERAASRQTYVNTTQPSTRTIPDAMHVVLLGDSLAYGAGDEKRKGLGGRLEEHLENRGVRSVEITNLGVNGAGTSDVTARLRQERVRSTIARADAVILSIGANDLFRTPGSRDATLRNPIPVANRILDRIQAIVTDLHQINPGARVLILGGYNPVPTHSYATLINNYLQLWDDALRDRFAKDPRVAVVTMSDIVVRDRLSRLDNFHPGGEAYEEAAKRISDLF